MKLTLSLDDNLTPDQINTRIEGIETLLVENQYNLNFNPNSDPRILELNKSVNND